MRQSIQEWTKQNLWKTAFKKFDGIWSALSRPYSFKFFKGCLPQILLGPFLNTLTHVSRLRCDILNCFEVNIEENRMVTFTRCKKKKKKLFTANNRECRTTCMDVDLISFHLTLIS